MGFYFLSAKTAFQPIALEERPVPAPNLPGTGSRAIPPRPTGSTCWNSSPAMACAPPAPQVGFPHQTPLWSITQAPKPHSPHRISWYNPNIPPIKTLPRPAASIKARNLCVPLPCNFNLVTGIFKAMASAAGFYTVMAETYI